MRVAVTGAAGFIGRAVVAQLDAFGHEAVPLDLPVHDIRQPTTLAPIVYADAVVHLAGVLGTAELWDDVDTAIDVNVRGALNVLNACRSGDTRYVGITMPDCWANVYQATKQCAQTLALGFHRDFGVPVTHIRAFNAYGVGQKHGRGHPQKIVPTFASRIYAGEPVPIWGEGDQTVDLVHVDHIASCLVDAAISDADEYGHGQVWDAGSGIETSVLDVARAVRHCTGLPAEYEFLPMRPGETPHTRLCAASPPPQIGFDQHFDTRLAEVVASYAPVTVLA